MSGIKLTIDGKEIIAQSGQTVLTAARNAGIEIPTLCSHPDLEPYGGCRLCIVEIEGMRGFPPSCTTPAADGMVVKTSTEQIFNLRKEVLKLLLSSHTSPCLVCWHREPCEKYRPRPFKTGKATRCTFCSNRDDCELRHLSDSHGITEFDMPIIYKNLGLERNDPFMDRDYNLCVLCGRCARICKKIHGKGAIEFTNRGKDARIGTAFHRAHTDTNCKFCGACVDICPVGSLTDRFAKWYGAPDAKAETTCTLCPHGCSIRLSLKQGKAISSGMVEFTREARICAVGRFVLPQILDNPARLIKHQVRIEDGLINAEYHEAVARAAEKLALYTGDQFALVTHSAATREEIYLLKKFTNEVMKSDNFAVASPNGTSLTFEPASVGDAVEHGKIKALFSTGYFFGAAVIEKLELAIVSDLFLSEASKKAEIVFAAADLAEIDGTFLNAAGQVKSLTAAAAPPDNLPVDWKIIRNIATKMGSSGFNFNSAEDINKEMAAKGFAVKTPVAPDPSPLDEISALPRLYRGHELTDIARALKGLVDLACSLDQPPAPAPAPDDKLFKILEKIEIVPNTYMVTVHAPEIAKKCQPGQFVIAMVNEMSERIPYTISDFDREKGTVTLVTLELGRSSREMANTRAGEHLAHFVGPLGMPIEVKKYGTVVCAGGCFGVGAILPIARAMKEAGNRVICVEEASSHYLLHWRDKLSAACDELIIVTKDGSAGMKGGVQEVFQKLVGRGEKIDQSFVIGCTFMMMMVSLLNRELEIPTQTAMNPLMLDGTGMCGACRVSLGDETKFACVDGPFLDGLKVNWEELVQRQAAFRNEEISGMPQEPAEDEGHGHTCTCKN